MKAIVAIDQAGGIGYKNGLPWPKIKEDLQWFKEFTIKNTHLIMGRKTFDAVGELPKRINLVLSNEIQGFISEGAIATTLYIGLEKLKELTHHYQDAYVVCGGAEIYKLLVPYCEELYITHVNGTYEADTFFPFSQEEVFTMFPVVEHIRELTGGHTIIKYEKLS